MRICFLVHELARSGGVDVINGHAERLVAGGRFEPELVVTGPDSEAAGGPAGVPVRSLAEARGQAYDVAIATWWTTAAALHEVEAGRRVIFLQGLEQRFYREPELFERLGGALALSLPAGYLAVSNWIRDVLAELHPGARCRVVPNGVDKATFAARAREPRDGPLRVLVEGQPGLWFKGVEDAVSAVRAMSEPAALTLVALDRAEAESGGLPVDRVVGGLDRAGMADLYASTDVLVKLSRTEGLGMAPLEAFHLGVPCVVTPYGGHSDYLVEGENGFVVGFDELPATTARLDLLARDRELLARLSRGALAAAELWPGEVDSTALLAEALEEIAAEPAPEPALERFMRAVQLGDFMTRQQVARLGWRISELEGAVSWNEGALADARVLVEELSSSRDACAEMLEAQRLRLVEVESSRAHRAADAVQRLLRRDG